MSGVARYSDGRRVALYAAIGNAIRKHREEAGLTVREVAVTIGVHPSTLSGYEGGYSIPLHSIVSLADVFDCTLDDLVPVLAEAR